MLTANVDTLAYVRVQPRTSDVPNPRWGIDGVPCNPGIAGIKQGISPSLTCSIH